MFFHQSTSLNMLSTDGLCAFDLRASTRHCCTVLLLSLAFIGCDTTGIAPTSTSSSGSSAEVQDTDVAIEPVTELEAEVDGETVQLTWENPDITELGEVSIYREKLPEGSDPYWTSEPQRIVILPDGTSWEDQMPEPALYKYIVETHYQGTTETAQTSVVVRPY